MGAHALGVHDVVLLLQRHLRKAGLAATQRRADDRAGGGADPGAAAGIAMPAAAADGGAKARSEGGGDQCGPYRLIIGSSGRRRGLRRGILLAGRLIGRKGVEVLVRSGRDGDGRPRRRRNTRRQRNRRSHCGRYPSIDRSHFSSRFLHARRSCGRCFYARKR
jgi:hypothetical protein